MNLYEELVEKIMFSYDNITHLILKISYKSMNSYNEIYKGTNITTDIVEIE